MTLRFSKKEIIILVTVLLLTIALIFSGYFYYLNPKKTDLESKSAELKSAQTLLTTLQQNQKETSPVTVESVAALQRKVPVKPQLEQLILDLEKAEVVSGSQIKNMAFSEADVSAPQQNTTQQQQTSAETDQKTEETTKDENAAAKTDTTEQTDANKTTDTTQTQTATVPTGIKKLTVTLQVESDGYNGLQKFLEVLENLPRILVVESVSFSSAAEITDLDTEDQKLAYTLTLSAFYMPTLTDLQNQLPELAAPKPGNKTNPFNSFPDLPDQDLTE